MVCSINIQRRAPLLAVLFMGAFLAGCDSTGIITANSDGNRYGQSSLTVIPLRLEYRVGDSFDRQTDFNLLAILPSGGVRTIDPSDVGVAITDGEEDFPLEERAYPFSTAGEKTIHLVHREEGVDYKVRVGGSGGEDSGKPPDTSIEFHVNW